jgi:hypothetical protein
MTTCTEGNSLYADLSDCLEKCSYFPEATDADGNKLQTATTGDSVQCRTNAAREAATSSAAKACPEASENGGIFSQNTCGSACDNYCDVIKANCGWSAGGQAHEYLFKNWDDCIKSCEVLPIGAPGVDMTTYMRDYTPVTEGGTALKCLKVDSKARVHSF